MLLPETTYLHFVELPGYGLGSSLFSAVEKTDPGSHAKEIDLCDNCVRTAFPDFYVFSGQPRRST